jgi:hypothetical protein
MPDLIAFTFNNCFTAFSLEPEIQPSKPDAHMVGPEGTTPTISSLKTACHSVE